jgi:hypothetical protein
MSRRDESRVRFAPAEEPSLRCQNIGICDGATAAKIRIDRGKMRCRFCADIDRQHSPALPRFGAIDMDVTVPFASHTHSAVIVPLTIPAKQPRNTSVRNLTLGSRDMEGASGCPWPAFDPER